MSAVSTVLLLSVHSVLAAFLVSGVIGMVAAGGNVIPPVALASYFGQRSIGRIRGVSETGVQVGQSIGPILSGLIFDITDSYLIAFLAFTVVGLTGAGFVTIARPPAKTD